MTQGRKKESSVMHELKDRGIVQRGALAVPGGSRAKLTGTSRGRFGPSPPQLHAHTSNDYSPFFFLLHHYYFSSSSFSGIFFFLFHHHDQ